MTDPPGAVSFQPARPDDVHDIAELWCEAFPGRRTVADRVRALETGGRYGGLDTVIVGRDGGQVVAACKSYRMEERILGVAVPMLGLAAVAVALPHRRRGLGAELCTEAIRRGAERGEVASVLYPFRPDYYERLGWGLVGELHDYRFRTRHLPAYPEADAVREAVEADYDAVTECYDRVATRSNGLIARDDSVWEYALAGAEIGVLPVAEARGSLAPRDHPRRWVVVYEEDGIRGYALLRIVDTRAGRDRRVDIRELVAETEAAYRGLLGYVASRADALPLARHFARPDERFGDRLRDPRPPRHRSARSLYFPTCRVVRGPMLRILDLPRALRLRPWYHRGGGRGPRGTLRIAVTDPQLPRNEGAWRVQLDGRGAGRVAADVAGVAGGLESDVDAAISTDASTYARIHVGELTPTDAARLGRATIHGDRAILDAAFATSRTFWLLDEF